MQQFFSFVIAVIVVLWLYLTYKWIRVIFDEDNSKLLNTAGVCSGRWNSDCCSNCMFAIYWI